MTWKGGVESAPPLVHRSAQTCQRVSQGVLKVRVERGDASPAFQNWHPVYVISSKKSRVAKRERSSWRPRREEKEKTREQLFQKSSSMQKGIPKTHAGIRRLKDVVLG